METIPRGIVAMPGLKFRKPKNPLVDKNIFRYFPTLSNIYTVCSHIFLSFAPMISYDFMAIND